MSFPKPAASADDLEKSDSQTTLIYDMDRLNTGATSGQHSSPTPSSSAGSVTITIPQLLARQTKRSAPGDDGNTPSTSGVDGRRAKRGKPNIPPTLDGDYKALRNLRAKTAKLQANYVMLKKYIDHHEHIAPMLFKVRKSPPFGADDRDVRAEWAAIQREAEKSFMLCIAAYLKKSYKEAEAEAQRRLNVIKTKATGEEISYKDVDEAATTVATRVKNAESLRLRQRWVHDIGRLEANKCDLPATKQRRADKGNKGNKAQLPKSSAAADDAKPGPSKQPTSTKRVQKKAKRQLTNNTGSKSGKKDKFAEQAATLKAILELAKKI